MSGTKENLVIQKGSTFKRTIRWETSPLIYKDITAVSLTAPVRVTCPLHSVPDGWRVAIAGIVGTKQLNAQFSPPRVSDYKVATVIDPNTLEFNDINAQTFSAYISGGAIQYNTPSQFNRLYSGDAD